MCRWFRNHLPDYDVISRPAFPPSQRATVTLTTQSQLLVAGCRRYGLATYVNSNC